MNAKNERIQELVGILKKADIAYYRDDDPVMTDREYEQALRELKGLEEETGVSFRDLLLSLCQARY